MFLSKLLLRIKGELLVLREDLTREGDLREKAAELLEKLELLVRRPVFRRDSSADVDARLETLEASIDDTGRVGLKTADDQGETEEASQRSLAELERVLDEVAHLRGEKGEEPHAPDVPPPNPRKLG